MAIADKNDEPAQAAGSSTPNGLDPKANLEVPVEAPVRFRFRCRGRRFSAEVGNTASGTVVRVTADAGYIPYTAESPPLRRALLKALATAQAGVEIAPDQRILLKAEMAVEPPVRPERVVATAVALAITSGGALAQLAKLYTEAPESA